VDKLQFLSFIFAILLSITLCFIALRLRGLLCISTLKFCWNWCKCFEISIFQIAICYHVEFLNWQNFIKEVWRSEVHHDAKYFEILPSVQIYCDFYISLNGCHHLDYFLKFAKFCWLMGSRGWDAPSWLISSKLVNLLWRYCDFSLLRLFVILDLFVLYLDCQRRVFQGLCNSAKFGYDQCSSSDNMSVSIFGSFGWKMLIHAPKICFLGAIWTPKWAAISTISQ